MRRSLRSLLSSLLALVLYLAVLPRVGLWLDHRLELIWRLPAWIDPLAGLLIVLGIALTAWSLRTFAVPSNNEPPRFAASAPAADSPLVRGSRSPMILGPMILGYWMLGAGFGLLLRSVSLIALVAAIALAASVYVHGRKEQEIVARSHAGWRRYLNHIPGWLTLVLVITGTLAGLPAVTHSAPTPHLTEPAILVQIRCKPGTADLWREDFEQHIRPAIEELISRGDGYTSFEFLQPALPGQGFDFALLYTGKTYAALDQPRIPPQYLVLLDREGTVRTLATVREMGAWEDQVTVSLVHLTRTR